MLASVAGWALSAVGYLNPIGYGLIGVAGAVVPPPEFAAVGLVPAAPEPAA